MLAAQCLQRVKPSVNWSKLNTDGSAQGNPGLTRGGGIIRDSHGNWISGFARAIGIASSLAAELWAVRDGLQLCSTLALEAVEVECDALVAVSLLSQANRTNSEFSSLIDDCKNLMRNLPQVRLKHCFREANRCADALAKFGANMEDDFVVFASPTSVIASLLFSDKLGVTQDRICNSVVATT
nr:putative ribonuclease h protein [Quercus suber]